MKVVLQRVKHAKVTVDEKITGEISNGYLVLLGITHTDTKQTADKMLDKISKVRIFEDENGKINKSISDVGGSLLVVSQFTLYADCRKGNRPGFEFAAKPDFANELYEYFLVQAKTNPAFKTVGAGIFGAYMQVELLNDGPFTLVLEME